MTPVSCLPGPSGGRGDKGAGVSGTRQEAQSCPAWREGPDRDDPFRDAVSSSACSVRSGTTEDAWRKTRVEVHGGVSVGRTTCLSPTTCSHSAKTGPSLSLHSYLINPKELG